MSIKARNLLAYLAVKYSQNWNDMFNAIKTKENVDYETIENTIATLKGDYITIIDADYPEELKHIFRPPFVIFLNQEDQKKLNDTSSRIYCSEYNLGDGLIESPYEIGLEEAIKLDLQDEFEETFNLTAPVPTTNQGLTSALGKTLKRPTILPVPEFVLKLIFSEGARVLTDGQSAIPKKLLDLGFEFKFKTIEETIENLV